MQNNLVRFRTMQSDLVQISGGGGGGGQFIYIEGEILLISLPDNVLSSEPLYSCGSGLLTPV